MICSTTDFHGVPNPLSSIVLLSLGLLLENGDENGQRITPDNCDACFELIGRILNTIDTVFGKTYGVTLYRNHEGVIGAYPIKTSHKIFAEFKGMYELQFAIDKAEAEESDVESDVESE